ILRSWDLAMDVVETLGTERLLGWPGKATDAAQVVRRGLEVSSSKGSKVISIAYRHGDPELAVQILDTLLNRYFEKHLTLHRSIGAFDFVAEQKQVSRTRLDETERELNRLKSEARVISLVDTNTAINETLTRVQRELEAAEVQYAEQHARVEAIENLLGESRPRSDPSAPRPGQAEVQQYGALVARLGVLRREGLDLLSRYTPESRLVRMNRDQIAQLEIQRADLEKRFPDLSALGTADGTALGGQADLLGERTKLAAIKARTDALRKQVALANERQQELAQLGPQIAQLERRLEVEQQNFRYLDESLERARVDEALDPSKIPNISVVQRPSPANLVDEQINKQIAMLAGGGVVLGLGLVFLLGFVFDRSIKRPVELQRKLRLNHLLAIPYARRGELRALSNTAIPALPAGTTVSKNRAAASKARMEHFVQPYCDSISDRLIHYFAMAGKTHKPKLIGVTACHSGAGTSTIAAGLAAALSRTGDGKVLLVDMNPRRSDHRYYYGGHHISSLVEILEPGNNAQPAAENLYLAAAASASDSPRPLPTRFHHLLPRLKHSEFDYIVFDMPPAEDSSPTLAMSGFMDKVLLVVEAEKTSRPATQRVTEEFQRIRADASILVNKTRQHGPRWLSLES
ncbi:MAG TPA: hypothetical protein VHF69_01420, partial [Candidatus Synoicihabitans sp.]|nr:hypothetical protein [Candidatus Synoicihabitans sp.]